MLKKYGTPTQAIDKQIALVRKTIAKETKAAKGKATNAIRMARAAAKRVHSARSELNRVRNRAAKDNARDRLRVKEAWRLAKLVAKKPVRQAARPPRFPRRFLVIAKRLRATSKKYRAASKRYASLRRQSIKGCAKLRRKAAKRKCMRRFRPARSIRLSQ